MRYPNVGGRFFPGIQDYNAMSARSWATIVLELCYMADVSH